MSTFEFALAHYQQRWGALLDLFDALDGLGASSHSSWAALRLANQYEVLIDFCNIVHPYMYDSDTQNFMD